MRRIWASGGIASALAGLIIVGQPSLAYAPKTARQEAEVAAAARAIAKCHFEIEADRIERYLLADPAANAFEKWEDKRSDDCIYKVVKEEGTWTWHRGEGLRYALAEELVRLRLSGVALADLDRVAPLPHDRPPYRSKWENFLSRSEWDALPRQKAAAVFLSKMGECVVRSDPAGSRAILESDPASPAERRAIQSLMPALQRCVEKSQTLEFDRASLRGAIALNFLRLAKAPRLAATIAGAER